MLVHDYPEVFLESFEQAALVARLEKSRWDGQLGVLSIGKAQAVYGSMTWEEARDYEKVKKEILYQLDINPETYRQAFRSRKQWEAKEQWALLQWMADLASKWLEPVESFKSEICDKILLEQFLNDLEEETQKWVHCHRPGSSAEALQLAENFSTALGEKP
ncbi:hypothetical protein Y1Q_0004800 [Alligator mississippiensis]|uniref:SCAN box domain-containing protein n=1 Tax=Alligator mississippiensis TaxID=8496 RepID=A0A151NQM6_ALLMI|nr:hypothetical protein Y1Q_0004800 [Alligator mississippiensis]